MDVSNLLRTMSVEIAALDLRGRARSTQGGIEVRIRQALQNSLVLGKGASRSRLRGEASSFAFAEVEAPRVSIIVPVFNHIATTLACLESIARTPARTSYEVIVVDDCSTDASAIELGKISGLRIHRNAQNLGFVRSCNAGARIARGDFVCFLNNDTLVTPGWLDELVDTFDLIPNTGLVGSKLLYPDGSLQEAGGIIWRDGTGLNYGKYDNPDRPEYSYAREVDYCSGASILLPRALFEKLGGFDELFVPAYYEDTDLAFRIREKGLKVIYQPLSRVIHLEGKTSGTDLTSGAKRHQVTNRIKFVDRWRQVLLRHHEAPGSIGVLAKDRHAPGPRVLVVDASLPRHDNDSGSLRMRSLLSLLRELGCKVTFVPNGEHAAHRPYRADLQRRGIEVLHYPYVASPREHLRSAGWRYDAIVFSRPDIATRHIDAARRHAPRARIIFDTVDLHFVREEREGRLNDDGVKLAAAAKRKHEELSLAERADVTIAVSELERDKIIAERPGTRVLVVSNIHDEYESSVPFANRRDFLFLGGFEHTPNVDAVLHFVRAVLPKLRGRLGDAKFLVVGSKPPPEVRALACEDIVVTGFVPDLRPWFERSRLSVAPLRYGAGVKGKINMSMAWGVPVVATEIAVEGMRLEPGRDVVIGRTDDELADKIVELYFDEERWEAMAQRSRSVLREHYSRDAARSALRELVDIIREPR